MNRKPLIILSLALFGLFLNRRAQAQSVEEAYGKMQELVILQDEPGIRKHLQTLEALEEKLKGDDKKLSKVYTMEAFGSFNLILINFGQVPDMMELFNVSRRKLEAALELDPGNIEAYCLQAMIVAQASTAQAIKAGEAIFEKARKINEHNAKIDFSEGMIKLFTPEGGAEYFKKAITGFGKAGQATKTNWWYVMAHAFVADISTGGFRQEPDYDQLQKHLDIVKDMRPDMGYLRIIEAYGGLYEPLEKNELPEQWFEVGSDKSGDAADPSRTVGAPQGNYSLFDVASLQYHLDVANGLVWFKIKYNQFPNEDFGVNLLFETDGDESTGSVWNYNREGRYDHIATLFLRKQGEKYKGVNGLATGFEFSRRRMTSEGEGNVMFYVDQGAKQLYVAVTHKDIGSPASIKVALAAGSNQYWTDGLPDKGYLDVR